MSLQVRVQEHKSTSYAPRTYHNATSADLTVAFALDFSTAGEKLTKKAAGDKFISVDLGMEYIQAARILYRACKKHNVSTLNIAGNGIYTLEKKGLPQHELNVYLYSVLSLVHEHHPLKLIISGGQTGVDLAGGVVASYMGIPCMMTFPKGFKQRFSDGKDVDSIEADILNQVSYWVVKLKEEVS